MVRRSTIWVDVNGVQVMGTLRASSTVSTVQTQLSALSNASPVEFWEGTDTSISPASTAAQFQTVADYVNLLYSTSAGNLVAVRLFAPKASIFKADLETVDSTLITSLTTAVLAQIVDANGNAVTSFVGGTRQRANRDY